MSSKNTKNQQVPQESANEELKDEELKSVAGGKQDLLIDSDPPAEAPSQERELARS